MPLRYVGKYDRYSDDTGAVAAKFAYTPFGEVIDSVINQPAFDIPIGFAGQFGVLREPNGLYYMNARYYDPTMGRFLSEDPVGLSGRDLTLYSYAGNNPVVFVDPSGLCGQSTQRRPGISVDLNLSSIHQDYILNSTAAEPLTKGNEPQSFNDLGGVSVSLNIGYAPQTGDYYTEFSLGLSDYLGVTAGSVHNLKDNFGEEASYFRINLGVGLPILPIPFSAESGVKQ
jgi:RHS repeat-associated protein